MPHSTGSSKREAQAKSEIPWIDKASQRRRACNLAVSTKALDRPIRIQGHVRRVRARSAEVWMIRDIERLSANLKLETFGQPDIPKDVHIEIRGADAEKLVDS